MGADVAAGLREHLRGGGHGGAVAARPAGARPRGPRARGPMQEPDRRLAVDAGDGHDLVQQPVLRRARGAQIALPLHGGVLPQTGSGHGHLLGGVGNRDF
jgi:hypothetical protein